MKFILTFVLAFNIFASDIGFRSCFKLFKVQTRRLNSVDKFPYDFSKVIRLSPKGSRLRDVSKIRDFKLGTYNLENFSSSSLRLSEEEVITKTKNIMMAIDKSNLDIVTLQEVLDPKYLVDSVKEYLGRKYRVMLIDQPDVFDKIAFLVKKDLPFEFKLRSMSNYKLANRKVFNKDFPILEMISENKPVMFFAGLHLKSKFGGKASNKYFESIREGQIKSILKIQNRISNEYSNAPFIIAGDFNNNIIDKPKEFDLLRKYMTDSFDLSSTPTKERLTNISRYKGRRIVSQLDGIFFNNKYLSQIKVKDTKVFQHTSNRGFRLKLSDHRTKRGAFPSDHSLLTTTIDLQRLLKR